MSYPNAISAAALKRIEAAIDSNKKPARRDVEALLGDWIMLRGLLSVFASGLSTRGDARSRHLAGYLQELLDRPAPPKGQRSRR